MKKFVIIDIIVTMALFIAGFIVPPTGVIDGSVLTAGGILSLSVLFGQLPVILDSPRKAKISHGNTSIEIK